MKKIPGGKYFRLGNFFVTLDFFFSVCGCRLDQLYGKRGASHKPKEKFQRKEIPEFDKASPQETKARKGSYFRATFLVKSSYESENFRKKPRRPLLQKLLLSYFLQLIFVKLSSCGHKQVNGPKK